MTLEEAQARIVDLQEQLEAMRTERDTLSQNNTQLTEQLEASRTLNHTYFEKLSQQHSKPDAPEEDPTPVPSCEEFAKTITF